MWLLGGVAPRSPCFHFPFAFTIVLRNANGRVKAEEAWEQASYMYLSVSEAHSVPVYTPVACCVFLYVSGFCVAPVLS